MSWAENELGKMTRDILRVGIIGCGGIARSAHIPAYLGCEDRVEVAAVADVVGKRAEECADEFSIPRAFSDYVEMIEKAEPDAVSVCIPNKFHAPATVAALEGGCHVLCEKPPAIAVEEAEWMATTARRTGKRLFYGFQYRRTPEVDTLKRFAEGGELGEIYAARAQALRRRGIPGWGVFTDKDLQGGGPLIDIGVHVLDTALYLMGYPEPDVALGTTYLKIGNRKGVGLWGTWDWENYSAEDMAVGMIRFRNGAALLLETSFAANVGTSEELQVSLMGDRGGADLFPLTIYQERHDTLLDTTPVSPPTQSSYELQIQEFVEYCLTGAEPLLATPEEGVILQRIVDALYRSARAGEAIRFRSGHQADHEAP